MYVLEQVIWNPEVDEHASKENPEKLVSGHAPAMDCLCL